MANNTAPAMGQIKAKTTSSVTRTKPEAPDVLKKNKDFSAKVQGKQTEWTKAMPKMDMKNIPSAKAPKGK